MLKQGWYPGIPGWHMDFAPGWESITDFSQIDPNEQHFAVISHAVSQTMYLTEPIQLNAPQVPRLNGYLSRQLAALGDTVRTAVVEPLIVYRFGQLDLHRVMPAKSSGWRLFVRASHTKLRHPRNEIRTQQQVYILEADEHAGW